MDGVAEIEVLNDRGRVGGIVVHVMTTGHLARASMAAPIDSDHAISVVEEEQHLGIPIIGAERPAMVEDDGLALAPVLVENLDGVFGCDRVHCLVSCVSRFIQPIVRPAGWLREYARRCRSGRCCRTSHRRWRSRSGADCLRAAPPRT